MRHNIGHSTMEGKPTVLDFSLQFKNNKVLPDKSLNMGKGNDKKNMPLVNKYLIFLDKNWQFRP